MFETNPDLGKGGTGLNGSGPGSLNAIITELQGFRLSLLAGANADTKIDLAAIRQEDTVVSALNNNAGVITDITGTISVTDCRASGTVTLTTAVAGNTVTINDNVYTAVAGTPADYSEFSIDTSDTAAAASLAAAINARESAGDGTVTATSALGVVTVTAVAEGTGGNAITMTKVGAPIALSGAVLSGGTATGGIQSTGATDQVILFWFNKK